MRSAAAGIVVFAIVVAAGSSAAGESPKVLDGKKVKKLSVIQEAPPGVATVDPTPEQVASCAPPACARIDFVYRPAKGVTAPLTVSERNFWAGLGDEDLYRMQGRTVIASCTGTLSNKRYLEVPAKALTPGKTHSAVMYYSHEIGESTSMDVHLPGVDAPEPLVVTPSNPYDYSITMCGT